MAKEHTINLVVNADEAFKAIRQVNKTLALVLQHRLVAPETEDQMTRKQWADLIEASLDQLLVGNPLVRRSKPTPKDAGLFAEIAACAMAAIEAIDRNDKWTGDGAPYVEAQKIDTSYTVKLDDGKVAAGWGFSSTPSRENTFEVVARVNETTSIKLNGVPIHKIKSYTLKGRELTLVMDIDIYNLTAE